MQLNTYDEGNWRLNTSCPRALTPKTHAWVRTNGDQQRKRQRFLTLTLLTTLQSNVDILASDSALGLRGLIISMFGEYASPHWSSTQTPPPPSSLNAKPAEVRKRGLSLEEQMSKSSAVKRRRVPHKDEILANLFGITALFLAHCVGMFPKGQTVAGGATGIQMHEFVCLGQEGLQ